MHFACRQFCAGYFCVESDANSHEASERCCPLHSHILDHQPAAVIPGFDRQAGYQPVGKIYDKDFVKSG
jgi:hypothetical protein